MIGVGGGTIPASRFLRRRAAAEDLGAADVDAFWSAAPRLYDFSQQQAPRPPSPSLTSEQEARDDPCILMLPRRSPSPLPATRRSPSPPPELEPRGACLLTLRRGCVGWGARRSVAYRHTAGDGGGSPPHAVVAAVEKAEMAGKSARQNKRAVVKTEEVRRVARSSLQRCSGAYPHVELFKQEEAEAAPEEVSCQDEKQQLVNKEKTRNGKRERSDRDRRRDAAKRAKKIVPLKDENEEGTSGDKKRKRPAASSRVKREVDSTGEVRVYNRRRRDAAKLAEKTTKDDDDEDNESKTTTALAPKPTSSPRGKEDRWPARRYAAGVAVLHDILCARGASAGDPAPRAELRAEARKRIGDTGLLDHLLLHAADRVPAGTAERIRRRHNVDGALEYFLEPAGLKALREEVGVNDPFWVPPPGWMLGDPTSPHAVALAVKKRVEELAAELAVVKRQMKQLGSNLVHLSKETYISWKGYDCMLKANENLEKELLSLEEKYDNAARANGELKEELLLLKENYESMAEKNAKLEEQIVDISSCFQFLKDDLPLSETEGGDEQHMLMLEPADHRVKEPYKADIVKQEARAGIVPGDVVLAASIATVGEGSISEKRMSRKCSMRICKPQDTSAGVATGEACSPKALSEPLTPGGDLILTNFDTVMYNLVPPSVEEYLATDGLPTHTSASSTTAASPLQQLLTIMARDDDSQTVQPCPGSLDSQLLHKDMQSSSSAPCLLETKTEKKALVLGGDNVGSDLAVATPSY